MNVLAVNDIHRTVTTSPSATQLLSPAPLSQGYNDIQAENERLTSRVGELMNEMDSSNYKYAQTMQQIKSDSFKLRMMLEQKFRCV